MEQYHNFSSLQIFCTQKSSARQITNTAEVIHKYYKEESSLVGIIRVEIFLVGSEIPRGLGVGETSIGLGETLHGQTRFGRNPRLPYQMDASTEQYKLAA